MIRKLLPLFSYIFHPLFVGIYAVFAYFFLAVPYFEYTVFYILFIQIVIVTILVPVTFYYLLMSLGLVDSVMLEKSTQRKIPLLIHCLLLLVLIKKSILSEKYPELNLFFVASLVSTIFALILVFLKQKASLHMVGIVGLTVFVMALSWIFQIRMILPIVILLLTCGFVASSRLYMKAHTNRELLLGSLVGALPQILLVWMPEIQEFFQKTI
jgi:hypothetical protein